MKAQIRNNSLFNRRFEELVIRLKKYNVLDEPDVKRLLENAYLFEDLSYLETISGLFSQKYRLGERVIENDPFPIPKQDQVFGGPIEIGNVAQNGAVVSLSARDLTCGTIISGITGTGKSTLMFQIARQVKKNLPHVKQLFIDTSKKNFRHLLPEMDLIALDWKMGHPKINLLRPVEMRGLDIRTRNKINIQVFAELFGVCFHQWAATPSVLAQFLEELNQLYDVYNQTAIYPTIQNLFDFIVSRKSVPRELLPQIYNCRKYLQGLLNFLGPLLVYDTSTFEKLILENNVVIELNGIQQDYKKFLVNAILMRVFQTICYNRGYGDLFMLVYLDEGEYVFSQSQNERVPFASDLALIGREYGMGLVTSCHEISKLESSVKDAHTKLFFSQGRESDVREAAAISHMNKEQADKLYSLETGTCVVKKTDGYPEPFLMKVMNVDIVKNVSDEMVQSKVLPKLKDYPFKEPPDLVRERQRVSKEIDDRWKASLRAVVDHWKLNLSEKSERIGINTSSLSEVYDRLEKEGMVEKYLLSLRRGQASTYHWITPKGARFLGADYAEVRSKIQGKGDFFPHVLTQNLVFDYLKSKGGDVFIERKIGDTFADVSRLEKPGLEEAFEIELNPHGNFQYALENILKDLAAGFSQVTVLCMTLRELGKIRELVEKSAEWPRIQDKVRFDSIKNFIA